jgi:hypothetical protein
MVWQILPAVFSDVLDIQIVVRDNYCCGQLASRFFTPALLITSSSRPSKKRYHSSLTRPTSPGKNQPLRKCLAFIS